MADNSNRKPRTDRNLQREARALALTHGIKYTKALRMIKNVESTTVIIDDPEDILGGA